MHLRTRCLSIWATAILIFLAFVLVSNSRFRPFPLDLNRARPLPQTEAPPRTGGKSPTRPSSTTTYQPTRPVNLSNWTFVPHEHAEHYDLDRDQCMVAFPKLYHELGRASMFWEGRRIGVEDVDVSWKEHGIVRAMIYDRRLYVLETKFSGDGYSIRRAIAILSSIQRSIVSYAGDLPNIEFSFAVSDIADPHGQSGGKPLWTFSRLREHEQQWLMPDFGFWSWGLDLVGEYSQIRNTISRNERPFPEKIPRALWRGAENSQVRSDLLREAGTHEWADIRSVTWSGRTTMSGSSREKAISIPEHCRWQFLVHTEGASYSGRGKYLFNCHSVVIAHELEWIENWHHLLVNSGPDQNFIGVKRDFSDLTASIEDLLAQPDLAQRVADNSVSTFRDRYLTPAAQACYWRELIHAWSSVSFEPQFWEDVHSFNEAGEVSRTAKRPRGTPYETFVVTAFDALYDGCGWFKKLLGRC